VKRVPPFAAPTVIRRSATAGVSDAAIDGGSTAYTHGGSPTADVGPVGWAIFLRGP